MKIILDETALKPLVEAFDKAPLPLALREHLWIELGRVKGADGFLDVSNVTATDTGDWCVTGRIGRAGELFAAALRALTIAAESESHHRDAIAPP